MLPLIPLNLNPMHALAILHAFVKSLLFLYYNYDHHPPAAINTTLKPPLPLPTTNNNMHTVTLMIINHH